MTFQLKTFTSIVAGMINHVRATQRTLNDFNIGSVLRTLLEAPGVEMDALYQALFDAIREAIPVATYSTFNFARLPATPASDYITVVVAAPNANLTIPALTTFTTPGLGVVFQSAADVIIPAGNTQAQVLVTATTPGAAGNIPAGLLFSAAPSIAGFVSATNAVAFHNGLDQETDPQRKLRFNQYISTLQRGTLEALDYGARTTVITDANGHEIERVRAVALVEPYEVDPINNPSGFVEIFIHNGIGSTSLSLVAQCQRNIEGYVDPAGNKIDGWKAAGVHATVGVASEHSLDVNIVLYVDTGFTPTATWAAAVSVIDVYIQALNIGQPFVEAECSFLLMSLPGVTNVTGLPGDFTPGATQKIVPGTVTVLGPKTPFAGSAHGTAAAFGP